MPTVLLIVGASGTGKTALARGIARCTNALVIPMDQLHLYRGMEKGTGLHHPALEGVRSTGYQMFSPWIRFSPREYVQWLRETLVRVHHERLIIIEGGCTSYLKELLSARGSDGVLRAIQVFALTFASEEERIRETEARVSMQVFREGVAELTELRNGGYYDESGITLFAQCENLFKHPELAHPGLAWALRISAGVYYPAHLVSVNEMSESAGRTRLLANLSNIQAFQDARIRSFLGSENVCTAPKLKERLESFCVSRLPDVMSVF